jgi:hypothetical protein
MLPRNKLLLSFFFVSLYSIAVETFLTRYFAVTNWAEYGYWIISIVMAGFAISGIVLSLFEKFFERHSKLLISIIPPALLAFTVIGLYLVSINQFNPLEFQNEVMWTGQLINIFKYYAALLPVFCLLGLYIGLVYVINYRDISKIYAVNLVASAIGSITVLVAMYAIDLFYLMAAATPLLLVPLIFSIVDQDKRVTRAILVVGLVLFASAEAFFIGYTTNKFPFYKPIASALNFEGNKVVKTMSLPEGYFIILDNATEFNNTDLSNNYSLLKMSAPPRSYGLYRDGRRICSLMKETPKDYSYLKGALDALPYRMRKDPSVIIAGTNGGFRPLERLEFGARSVVALESDATIYSLIESMAYKANNIKPDGKKFAFEKNTLYSHLLSNNEMFDIIDVASDYIGSSDNSKFSFTVDAVKIYLSRLNAGGILSMPVSITEFPVHSVKLLETIRRALKETGASYPEMNIIVYRSNWTARILASNKPFSESDIILLKSFCSERSFDTSYYYSIDPAKVSVFNDLPAVSFDAVTSQKSDTFADAIMTDSMNVLGKDGKQFLASHFFNLEPSTVDRPSFFSILRLSRLGQILEKRSILPQEEIGYLVNIFILVQAIVLALLILLLPLLRRRSFGSDARKIPRIMIYFASLGLGFLFIEMALIDRFSLFLGSSTASFAIVLSGMLIFSGAGSYVSSRFTESPIKGVSIAAAIIVATVLFYIAFLFPIILSAGGAPFIVKALIALVLIAPVSFALGMPFPLGLSTLREHAGGLLPWAWAINGAFSVISTPLANIVSVSKGFTALFVLSIALYFLAFLAFPGRGSQKQQG